VIDNTFVGTDNIECTAPGPVLPPLFFTTDITVGADEMETAINIADAINSDPTWSAAVTAAYDGAIGFTVTSNAKGPDSHFTFVTDVASSALNQDAYYIGQPVNTAAYTEIVTKLERDYLLQLYPSAAIAGVYASTDRNRGVWKAPANISLANVIGPAVNISAQDQSTLNIDNVAGKSINAIRAFAGKGTLVWGARTLAGNDSEWRYVNVRRLFNFVEESIAKATEFVVFEPNDANTWTRTKSMIVNFLTNLWRDGGLVGAKPEHAFFVQVGLGESMTPQDILDGKLIIRIGLAASRPAEFVILQFMHKLQES
jgi:phage tail sheath protein FI